MHGMLETWSLLLCQRVRQQKWPQGEKNMVQPVKRKNGEDSLNSNGKVIELN